MGGATPVLLSLAAEYTPRRHKGLVTTGVLLALPAGAMLGGILAAKIMPIYGWQSIYLLPKLNTVKILYFMLFCGIAIVAGLGAIIESQNWAIVFILIALAGFGVGGQQLVLNYLVIDYYPSTIRATATGWAIGMGRFGAILGSAIGGLVLSQFGAGGYFYALAVPLLLAFIRLRRKPLLSGGGCKTLPQNAARYIQSARAPQAVFPV